MRAVPWERVVVPVRWRAWAVGERASMPAARERVVEERAVV